VIAGGERFGALLWIGALPSFDAIAAIGEFDDASGMA
jgi:hypothetical protein